MPLINKNSSDGTRILVVDDMTLTRVLLDRILTNAGYDVVLANEGLSCLKMAIETQPKLILLDLKMPGIDGFETMARLMHEPKTAGIPIIFLTGDDSVDSKIKGFEMGAVDYIVKPFQTIEILARVRVHLKSSMVMRELIQSQQEKLSQIADAQQSLWVKPENFPEASFSLFFKQVQEAGGDFYDIFQIAGPTIGYFLADISGHDLATGFLTPAVKALLKQNCTLIYTPMESMRMLNHVLTGFMPFGKYLTATYLTINRRMNVAHLICMGHPPIFRRSADGRVERLTVAGDIVGFFENPVFGEFRLEVAPGDRFYLYSDGLIEGSGLAEIWTEGLDPLEDLIKKLPVGRSRDDDIEQLLSAVNVNEKQFDDDVLLLVVDV